MASSRPRALFGRLLLLFTAVPVVELVLLVWLGEQIGFWPTVALIIGTALVGTTLAHREGLAAWHRFQQRLQSGGLPGKELTDGLIILVAGALLLTPGVLTDVVGLLGLLPPTRALLRRALSKRLQRGLLGGDVHVASFGGPPPPPAPDVVDVEFEDVRRER
ncbi:MAG: FxsA family protein [Rhodothermales bacterium]|nr:FxsA family protein [Rhodothermales bacterium]